MTGELAGAADILTGAALARAVEPDTGEGRAVFSGKCSNCSTMLVGAHCHACGQRGNVHRTLRAFGHDFMHSVLHFDGKIWRTLPMLFWNPGGLTRRYVHGERAKFVSPLALFLFTVFLTFAAFNWLAPNNIEADGVVAVEEADKQYQSDRQEILDSIAELEAQKSTAAADGRTDYKWIDDQIIRLRSSLRSLDEGSGKDIRRSQLAARKIEFERSKAQTELAKLESQLAIAKAAGQPTSKLEEDLEGTRLAVRLMGNAAGALQNGEGRNDEDFRFTDLEFPGSAGLNQAVKHAAENPQLLLYKIQSNAYKFSWALIPISIPFVWLLFFWRRRFKMFDHAVFVTYSLTFMMLLGIIIAVLMQFAATEVVGGLALAFIPPIHIYRQLHHAYETSRFGAFWRMCVLSMFAVTALTLFAMLIITLGVTG